MKQIIILTCLVMLGCSIAKAESADEKESNVRISLTGELNSADAWRMDAGCHWFPVRYVGIGGSLGIWKQYFSDIVPHGQLWRLDADHEKASNLFIHPSLILMSPNVIRAKDFDICFYGEAGALINVPYERVIIDKTMDEYYIPVDYEKVSSNKGNYIFFDGKIGLSARFDRVSITAGYAFSTLDVYAQRRKMKYDNQVFAPFYPKSKATHGMFLSLSVNL